MTPDDYTALGYAVFPCEGKRPARASTWPTDTPFRAGDNIGMQVPVGAVVIDLDRKPGADGVKLLTEIMPVGWRHTGPRAATGGGGLHLWFGASPLFGLGNGRGDLPTGIDVRGGGNGYVIVPPSYHPETGVVYEWIDPLVTIAELPELPQWLLERLLAPSTPARPAALELPESRDLNPYIETALAAEAQAVAEAPEGAGNDTINRAAFNLGQLCAHGLGYDVAREAVAKVLQGWQWRQARDEAAAWRTFDSGWRAGEATPRNIPELRAPGPMASRSIPDRPPGSSPGESADHPNAPGLEEAAASVIRIRVDEQEVNDQAVQALGARAYPDLYQRGGGLCRVVRIRSKPDDKLQLPDNTPVIRPLSNATLRERLADAAHWEKYDKRGEAWVPAHPPQWSVLAVSDRGEYPGIPPLRGIANYPMIRPDGSICSSPGYDAGTGYYLGALPPDLQLQATATQDDAAAAAKRLLELVADFPFRDDVDRAAWLAYLLTPLARAVINGPTPLFLVEANVRGSGKTLLADVASLALTGHPLPAQTYPSSDEELEKVLVGVARLGLPVLCFDNVRGNLGGACLDKWLTSTSPTGRVLGSNDMPQFDWTTVLVATANNASVSGDTDRRSIYVTLETEHERPELRSGFAIPDLPAHLRAHRGKLLADILVILQAHFQAGLPTGGGRPKGTFESWGSRVRDAVMFAGLPDCERAPDDDARPIDSETDELAALLAGLWEHFAGQEFTVSGILDAAFPASGMTPTTARDLRDVLAQMSPRDQPARQLVGRRLARYRNRWLNDIALISVKDKHRKVQVWRIKARVVRRAAESPGPRAWQEHIDKSPEGGGETIRGSTHYPQPGELDSDDRRSPIC